MLRHRGRPCRLLKLASLVHVIVPLARSSCLVDWLLSVQVCQEPVLVALDNLVQILRRLELLILVLIICRQVQVDHGLVIDADDAVTYDVTRSPFLAQLAYSLEEQLERAEGV